MPNDIKPPFHRGTGRFSMQILRLSYFTVHFKGEKVALKMFPRQTDRVRALGIGHGFLSDFL
jgi:hypothetical protein